MVKLPGQMGRPSRALLDVVGEDSSVVAHSYIHHSTAHFRDVILVDVKAVVVDVASWEQLFEARFAAAPDIRPSEFDHLVAEVAAVLCGGYCELVTLTLTLTPVTVIALAMAIGHFDRSPPHSRTRCHRTGVSCPSLDCPVRKTEVAVEALAEDTVAAPVPILDLAQMQGCRD